jgi:predicted O-methyltransferase YrrM
MNQKLLIRGNKIWHQNEARNYPDAWASEVETSDFLYGFVRLIKPETCLEIGTFEGDASIAIARGLKDNNFGHLYTTDIKDFGQVNNIKDSGTSDFITCYIAKNPISDLFIKECKFCMDMIFIDDGHSYEEVTRDLNIANELCSVGGYILGHDVIGIKTVKQAYLDFLNKNSYQYENIVLASYAGLFILKRK